MSAQAYAPAATLPRLLHGAPSAGAMSLHEHVAIHGERSTSARGSRQNAAALIDELHEAGLRGRGGGAFPTAVKMRAVLAVGRAERTLSPWPAQPIVVVNAAESEPGSLKDQTLLEALPHLVLDGAAGAAHAVGADEVILCICDQAQAAHASVTEALRERGRGTSEGVRWHIARVPARYIAGQELALVSFLNGGQPRPAFAPPMAFERGVRGRPTLVNNAETCAHIALIARHGARWFRSLGTPAQPGSALVTLSGPVARPGVYEIEHGSRLTTLIEAAGGTTEAIRAVLIGGYAGTWVDGSDLDSLALSDDQLAPYGAQLGTGVVILLGAQACGLAESVRVTRWLAKESAGQCGPCKHGLDALARTLESAIAGTSDRTDADPRRRLAHLMSIVRGRGACHHPDGTVRFVSSALAVFADELSDHMRHGHCSACAHPAALPIPAGRAPHLSFDEQTYVAASTRGRALRTAGPRGRHERERLRSRGSRNRRM